MNMSERVAEALAKEQGLTELYAKEIMPELLGMAKAAIDAMDDWQPIETAPSASVVKKVWVFGGQYARPSLVHTDGGHWRYEKSRGSKHVPTHWKHQIVPEPPKETP